MNVSELIPGFDDAILNKNETDLFLTGQKIARKYSYRYFRRFNITCDYELIADEVTVNMLSVVKKTNWEKEPKYYFACIKQGTKFKYLSILKEPETVSLEAFATDEYGESTIDYLNLKPVRSERSSTEETILEYVHQVMELADQFLDKKSVEQKLGIDHKLFLFICTKYGIQFSKNDLSEFLDSMKYYDIYCKTGKDLKAARLIAKEKNLNGFVKSKISTAETYLDAWKYQKNCFMNRLILPPNISTPFDKVFKYIRQPQHEQLPQK